MTSALCFCQQGNVALWTIITDGKVKDKPKVLFKLNKKKKKKKKKNEVGTKGQMRSLPFSGLNQHMFKVEQHTCVREAVDNLSMNG